MFNLDKMQLTPPEKGKTAKTEIEFHIAKMFEL